jgi:exodeoxyribonuclease VII large subunit
MIAAVRHAQMKRVAEVERIRSRLLQQSPALRVQSRVASLNSLNHRLAASGRKHVQQRQSQLKVIARGLNSVSPLATLDRGYAIITDQQSGRLVSDSSQISAGDRISARLANGSVDATITKIHVDRD